MGFLDSIKWPLGKPEESEYNEDYDNDYDDPEDASEEAEDDSEPTVIKEEEGEDGQQESAAASQYSYKRKTAKSSGKVVNMQTGKAQAERDTKAKRFEIVVLKMPRDFHNYTIIAEALLKGKAVVLNLEDMEVNGAQSVIDFVTGACFTMNGDLKKISKRIFLATPNDGYIEMRTAEAGQPGSPYSSDINMMDMDN